MDYEMNSQKAQTAAMFINTTQEMINSEGLNNVSIRKIADKAGYHNSTIYLHFKDLDELLMLASMKHFHEYSQALEDLSAESHRPLELFLSIWDLFMTSVLKQPEIFYNFFFGKRSDNLFKIISTYYSIFPDEKHSFTSEIETMYYGNSIRERSLRILEPIVTEDTAVNADNLSMINDIVVSCCKYKLEEKCKDPTLENNKIKQEFNEILLYVCGISQ